MLKFYSSFLFAFIAIILSSSAVAKTKCKYLSDFENTSTDIRIQHYLNFYTKQGFGLPMKIRVPGCVAVESDQSFQERHSEWEQGLKDRVSDKQKEGFIAGWKERRAIKKEAEDSKSKAPKEPIIGELSGFGKPKNFDDSDKNYSYETINVENTADGTTKEKSKTNNEFRQGTALFCKGLAVCEEDDELTIANVFCRGSSQDECPSADECHDDKQVVMESKVNLKLETDSNFNDGTRNLEGYQTPGSAVKGR